MAQVLPHPVCRNIEVEHDATSDILLGNTKPIQGKPFGIWQRIPSQRAEKRLEINGIEILEEENPYYPQLAVAEEGVSIDVPLRQAFCSVFLSDACMTTFDVIEEDWPVAKEFQDRVSDTAQEFCNSRGLTSVLRTCFAEAKKIFSNTVDVYANLEYFQDDDSEDTAHISIRVDVTSDQQTAFSEDDAWVDWFVDNVVDEHRGLFILTVTRV